MYQLRKEIIKKLKEDRPTRNLLANAMGIGESGISMSLKLTKGRSIAINYDGMNFLKEQYNLETETIREKIK